MRRSMLIGLLFHPGKQWSDRNQKIWPWCCCLLAMLRSVVIGAKQLMFDKVLNVKNLHQLEIRLTRSRNLSILIASERRWSLDSTTKLEPPQATLILWKAKPKKKPLPPSPNNNNQQLFSCTERWDFSLCNSSSAYISKHSHTGRRALNSVQRCRA